MAKKPKWYCLQCVRTFGLEKHSLPSKGMCDSPKCKTRTKVTEVVRVFR